MCRSKMKARPLEGRLVAGQAMEGLVDSLFKNPGHR